ncbi:MAG: Na(+)-translocating NADH-quinone reductase subunit C [Acidiferrobacterales bacterium]|nr:Na(+)-translocating NADH-quinone reductase subunit C [Acidiferrobacterales bacterium]
MGNTQHIRFKQAGFLNLPNDNIVKTIGVAVLLCLVCSIIVSTAAVKLKPTQVANQLLDKKRNILTVAGIADSSKTIDELFEQVETKIIDIATGEYTDALDPETYDQLSASKDPDMSARLTKDQDLAQIGTRANYANVYLVRDGDAISKIVMPVKGYGLWSTLYGFIALESDAQTVSGITFYDHKETPGLGGEIDNPKWQATWSGKQLADQQGEIALAVIKGTVGPNTSDPEYKIDGLAGATLTSNGVTNLVKFWMGENGFGPYLKRYRDSLSSSSKDSMTEAVNVAVQSNSN